MRTRLENLPWPPLLTLLPRRSFDLSQDWCKDDFERFVHLILYFIYREGPNLSRAHARVERGKGARDIPNLPSSQSFLRIKMLSAHMGKNVSEPKKPIKSIKASLHTIPQDVAINIYRSISRTDPDFSWWRRSREAKEVSLTSQPVLPSWFFPT